MNAQEEHWAGPGGDAYTVRNRVDWRARIPFWHDMLKFTGARSVYEFGCNAGWNLSAIREAAGHEVGLFGCDLNVDAVHQAWCAGHREVHVGSAERMLGAGCELIVTAGVLIHIAPQNLSSLMSEIVADSAHWVIAIEYAAEAEEMIEYRGKPNLLWKRPYGKLYEAMGLKLRHTGDAVGFDRCTYWLMEKP